MARIAALAFVIFLYLILGWQGIVSGFIVAGIMHTAYRMKNGYWFGDY